MNYKAFPDSYWSLIEKTVSDLKSKNNGTPLVAAFDADGTLWDTDLGENFFQHQIDQKIVKLPDAPFEFYQELKKKNNDPRDGYVWLAQINDGQKISVVREWAQAAFNTIQPSPIFAEQKKLIDLLKANGVQIYIVTASIKWAVEPGALALGLSHDNVIGVETAIVNDLVTTEVVHPVTYRIGKVEALMKKTNSVAPFLSSGNTMGDFELLQKATHIRLAVSASSRDDRLFKTESELLSHAQTNNWLHHRFI